VDGDGIEHSCGVGVAVDLDGVTAGSWSAHHTLEARKEWEIRLIGVKSLPTPSIGLYRALMTSVGIYVY
jgi:hypothetical protein